MSDSEEIEGLPQLEDGQFPPDAVTEDDRHRFRLAYGIALELFGENGSGAVWMAARSIYRNKDLPT